MKYSDHFRKTVADTYDLQKPEILESYISKGFKWIRKYNDRSFENIVKDQTIGCTVELFFVKSVDCVRIDSPKGKKLINKLCYF